MDFDFLLNWSQDQIKSALNNDELLIQTANSQRKKLPSKPEQSEFRVYAFLIIEVEGRLIIVEGANAEPGYIGGSICAERACLVQLRKYNDPKILKVVVVTVSTFYSYFCTHIYIYICSTWVDM
mgnify:CR=1 FL=1